VSFRWKLSVGLAVVSVGVLTTTLTKSKLSGRTALPSTHLAVYDVRAFGARPDATRDSTKAIQAAIDAASTRGGGLVWFPPGVYIISVDPSTQLSLQARPNVMLKGAGMAATTIQLANRTGGYRAIIGANADASNFAVQDLTINSNTKNNPANWGLGEANPLNFRFSIQIYIGKNIFIERCRFTDIDSINTITVNGLAVSGGHVQHVVIANCLFDNIGGPVHHDHSTVFTTASDVYIHGNEFRSRGNAACPGAVAAIEIHGSNHSVTDNVAYGFEVGVQCTGVANESNNVIVTNNYFECLGGILIWSFYYGTNTSGPALTNCTIAHNVIVSNVTQWSDWSRPSLHPLGIELQPAGTSPFVNLKIIGNSITFQKPTDRTRAPSDYVAGGIDIWSMDKSITYRELTIVGNTITRPMSFGIRADLNVQNVNITQNTITNPGQSNAAGLSDLYRSAMMLGGAWTQGKVNDNVLADDQATRTMKHTIYCFCSSVTGCEAMLNTVKTVGAPPPVFEPASAAASKFVILNR
jgi:hypothetical protein